MACVKWGNTSGSDSISRQLIGPFLPFVDMFVKNSSTAALLRPLAVFSSIRETISGLKIPWAAGGSGLDEDEAILLRELAFDENGSVSIAACRTTVVVVGFDDNGV
eukprot:CAMPEP_0170896340 /NCGR_PEP_ID=MMETSP0734-20130129/44726_1 /TAXON_ID=186038 /ORGANISM="Fragilariopsis kerguelensis, Strain L26-C5" /LENGTH=105 /DNA_ID=CAMNT_0011288543 /DNA_START=398 /DNA_END=714 /DNA_ORIENTATION=-